VTTAWPLDTGWQLARFEPGRCVHPDDLGLHAAQWHAAAVPGTVAGTLHRDLDTPGDYDAHDWWYRTTFATPVACAGARHYLAFEGLATLAEVWLNGERILESRNMFRAHRAEVSALLRDVNHLAIRFASLESAMAAKRPRPRWKTALVTAQNLRWFRTTLLGRMPGWNPLVAPVGPWGCVALECVEDLDVLDLDLQARAEGNTGYVHLRARVAALGGQGISAARLRLDGAIHPLQVERGEHLTIRDDLAIPDAPLWWPHTHGTPQRLRCMLEVQVGGAWVPHDCGWIAFRQVEWGLAESLAARPAQDPRTSSITVNGVPVFMRGAVWTTTDILTLRADGATLRRTLEAARRAGVNMIRVGGTMHYERDAFYALCDELGILVWQDFMFANMDYPVRDAGFRMEVEAEARDVLRRLQRHACVAVYCGGSEVAQQAAMMGLSREHWLNDFFLQTLPALVAEHHAGIPYVPSTPWGGALPFHVGRGVAHYYGVGAYRRPLADVKGARVKFAAECLAFANVPEPATLATVVPGRPLPAPHDPRWKARLPRDNGAGWDFEDVRDHYLRELFGEDAVALRSQDLERYYALSRVVTGEVMARTFAEWRAAGSGCAGALVWTLQDVWPGAGWGLVDAAGRPKAALWHLQRAWAPRTVMLTDEGLDGLTAHIANDSPEVLDVVLEVAMFRDGRTPVAAAKAALQVPGHGSVAESVDGLLGYFTDATNAYRFGPPRQDVVLARLVHARTSEVIADAFHFPAGYALPRQHSAQVHATARWTEDARVEVTIETDAFLQSVAVSCEGFTPDDNYFHVAPGHAKRLVFTPWAEAGAFRASLEALNLPEAIVATAPAHESWARSAGPSASPTAA